MNTNKTFNLQALSLRSAVVSALALGASVLAVNSHAGTDTSNLPVSASVAANCLIDASSGLAFGAYDPVSANASADLDSTATVSVNCTLDSAVTITMGQGLNADAGSTAAAPLRRLTDGTNFLSYDLYSDAGYTTVLGDTLGTSVGYTGTGVADTVTAYGRIPGGQNVPVAVLYGDTVVATITF